ncbi:MAG: glycosyltransferase family 2 protein [Phycisphaerales bacterium]|nr:MAG: glycosyltransferase family 2 protein [Phycisphaerales bacterium]
MKQHVLVAIPVFNEERYLAAVLDQVRRYAGNVLVIDDGSTDGSPRILRRQRGLHVITHPENRGYGQSLADAFRFSIRAAYRWLVTIDCDEQHEPSYIPRFLAAGALDTADIISGTRYPTGREDATAAPADRRRINAQITNVLNRDLGLGITDAFCGFKAYRVSALRQLRITVPGYAMPLQLWVQAARAGLRIVELPVRVIYNDPNRHFGGMLDDPEVRLAHYLEVYEAERSAATAPARPCCCGTPGEACPA